MKLEVGKFYRTEGGDRAEIRYVDKQVAYGVIHVVGPGVVYCIWHTLYINNSFARWDKDIPLSNIISEWEEPKPKLVHNLPEIGVDPHLGENQYYFLYPDGTRIFGSFDGNNQLKVNKFTEYRISEEDK